MAMNNNNQAKNVGLPTHFGNSVAAPQSLGMNHQPHLLSQAQHQTHGVSHFPGHFQLSEPQAQALAQAQYVNAHAQAQVQASHAQFQTHLQAQAQSFAHLHNANTSNAGVSSPTIVTPGSRIAKKVNQKLPSRSPSSCNVNMSSPFKTMELTLVARRKKLKLIDNQIPDKVVALLLEYALYT